MSQIYKKQCGNESDRSLELSNWKENKSETEQEKTETKYSKTCDCPLQFLV